MALSSLHTRSFALSRSVSGAWTALRARAWARAGARLPHIRVTVVMPAYNAENYIERAILSVLGQSHSNLKLLVFDDASTDNTPDIVARLGKVDGRVSLWRSERNAGPYAAKNWCIDWARTDYVAFQDSDDEAAPHRIRVQMGAMHLSGAAASTVRWKRVDDAGTLLTVNGRDSRLAANSLMIRKSRVIRRVGYFDSVRVAADTEYLGRMDALIGAHRRLRLPYVGITGRFREGSLTTSPGSGMVWHRSGRHLRRELAGPRKDYLQNAAQWHQSPHVRPLRHGEQCPPFATGLEREPAHSAVSEMPDRIWPPQAAEPTMLRF